MLRRTLGINTWKSLAETPYQNKIPSADLPGSTSRDMGMKRQSTNAIPAITRSEVLRHDHSLLLQDFHFREQHIVERLSVHG